MIALCETTTIRLMSHSISARANVDLIDQKYSVWKQDPNSVDQSWAMFFEGFELGLTQPAPANLAAAAGGAAVRPKRN